MNEVTQPTRRNRLIHIANLLAAHERATPLARRVLECRLCLMESELIRTAEDEVAATEGQSASLARGDHLKRQGRELAAPLLLAAEQDERSQR
jgi:hypothetical protein